MHATLVGTCIILLYLQAGCTFVYDIWTLKRNWHAFSRAIEANQLEFIWNGIGWIVATATRAHWIAENGKLNL